MQFVSEEMMQQPTVTVRVEPPGYSFHEFVLPASHLGSPHFAPLMAKAEKEYGVNGTVVAIPCTLDVFIHAMVNTAIRAPFEPSHPPVGPSLDNDEPSPPGRRTLGWFLYRPH